MQVKVVAITGVQLDAGKVEFVTNVPATKTYQPVIRVVMSSGPHPAKLHGIYVLKLLVSFFCIVCCFLPLLPMGHWRHYIFDLSSCVCMHTCMHAFMPGQKNSLTGLPSTSC